MAISRALQRFIASEASGATVLFAMLALALFLANSSFAGLYHTFIEKPLHVPVNDGLMVLFFLLVGLEVKREVVQGELSTRAQAILPLIAAAAGMALPVAIYFAITAFDAALVRGWAIPSATDIAFALGILALLGKRVPFSLKIFLTAFAIIDDIGAVLIIGMFYTTNINLPALGAALLLCGALYILNRRNVSAISPYLIVGAGLWYAIMLSGLHGTIAGVLTALAVPLGAADLHRRHSPARHLEHMLHPWVSYGILPLFALVNAGLVLDGLTLDTLLAPLPLGIALGLFVGKQLGIFGACYALIKLGKAALPTDSSMMQLYGVAVLGGVGFTMSQFIGILAFPDSIHANAIKLGVIGGSLLSAAWGLFVLGLTSKPRP